MKIDREQIKNKYGGLCAYSGTILKDDWQIDHIHPKRLKIQKYHNIPHHDDYSNLVPVQRIINHYKRSETLESYRTWLLGELHLRLAKFPKKTKSERTIKHKAYLMEVAGYFNITIDQPFNRIFYFETLKI